MSINTPELTLPQDFDWQSATSEGSVRLFKQNDVIATGKYRILSDGPIATGMDANIYRAIDQEDDSNQVALKVYSERNQEARQRVSRELSAYIILNSLDGVVTATDIGVISEAPSPLRYLATYFADSTLEQFANDQTDNTERINTVVKMSPRVLRAITAIHNMGLIHRDIKPRNIFRYDASDSWDLTDFGLVNTASRQPVQSAADREIKAIDLEETVATAPIYGTPGYMAPEQFTFDGTSPKADTFSMGATIYHTLTGKLPFPITPPYSSHKVEVHCKNIADQPPSELTQQLRTRDVPIQLGTLVASCLEYKPDNRPTDKELISGIEAV